MRDFRLRSILAIIFAFTFQSNSYAKDGIYGCWNNIHQIKVDPKYSPLHENTTANGEIICFKKNGAITTVLAVSRLWELKANFTSALAVLP
jgi:hypothetical protein